MNTASRVLVRYPEGVVWTAALIGIPAWLAHLVFVASMTRYTEVHPGSEWTLHIATALAALTTLAGMAICLDLLRAVDRADADGRDVGVGDADIDGARIADSDDPSSATISRFLGRLGLLVGVTNLALILLEGSYVIFVRRNG